MKFSAAPNTDQLPTFANELGNRRATQVTGVPLPDCKNMLGSIMRTNISLPHPNMFGRCDGMQYRKFVPHFADKVLFQDAVAHANPLPAAFSCALFMKLLSRIFIVKHVFCLYRECRGRTCIHLSQVGNRAISNTGNTYVGIWFWRRTALISKFGCPNNFPSLVLWTQWHGLSSQMTRVLQTLFFLSLRCLA